MDTGEGEATEADETLYCFCQEKSHGEMIGCDNETCRFEWVRLREIPLISAIRKLTSRCVVLSSPVRALHARSTHAVPRQMHEARPGQAARTLVLPRMRQDPRPEQQHGRKGVGARGKEDQGEEEVGREVLGRDCVAWWMYGPLYRLCVVLDYTTQCRRFVPLLFAEYPTLFWSKNSSSPDPCRHARTGAQSLRASWRHEPGELEHDAEVPFVFNDRQMGRFVRAYPRLTLVQRRKDSNQRGTTSPRRRPRSTIPRVMLAKPRRRYPD